MAPVERKRLWAGPSPNEAAGLHPPGASAQQMADQLLVPHPQAEKDPRIQDPEGVPRTGGRLPPSLCSRHENVAGICCIYNIDSYLCSPRAGILILPFYRWANGVTKGPPPHTHTHLGPRGARSPHLRGADAVCCTSTSPRAGLERRAWRPRTPLCLQSRQLHVGFGGERARPQPASWMPPPSWGGAIPGRTRKWRSRLHRSPGSGKEPSRGEGGAPQAGAEWGCINWERRPREGPRPEEATALGRQTLEAPAEVSKETKGCPHVGTLIEPLHTSCAGEGAQPGSLGRKASQAWARPCLLCGPSSSTSPILVKEL